MKLGKITIGLALLASFLAPTFLPTPLAFPLVTPRVVISSPVADFSAIRDASFRMTIGESNSCSAVLIDKNTLLTASHCVEDADTPQVRTIDGSPVEVVSFDKEKDIAIIKAEVQGTPIPLAQEDVPLDYPLVMVGFPASHLTGQTEYLTEGRRMADHKDRPYFMNTTIPIAGGNSGGGIFALINGKWYVVGVAVAVYVIGDGFFMPINFLNHMSIAVNLKTIKEYLNVR